MDAQIRRRCQLSAASACLAFAVAAQGVAQDAKLQLKNLEVLAGKAAEVVDVTLDGPMLRLAEKFMAMDEDSEDVEARTLIKNLKGIYVRSFEFDKPGEYTQADLESIRTQLRTPNWSRIVNVRSRREGENAEIYLMTDGNEANVKGLAIISAEPKELTVVNIVGPLDLDRLSQLEGKMGIPRMELEKEKGPGPQKPEGAHEKQK